MVEEEDGEDAVNCAALPPLLSFVLSGLLLRAPFHLHVAILLSDPSRPICTMSALAAAALFLGTIAPSDGRASACGRSDLSSSFAGGGFVHPEVGGDDSDGDFTSPSLSLSECPRRGKRGIHSISPW